MLEKAVKELNGRIVDFETKSYANSPKPDAAKLAQAKVSDLQAEIKQLKEKNDSLLAQRSSNQNARTIQHQLAESERQRARQEEETRKAELKVEDLKEQIDQLVCLL